MTEVTCAIIIRGEQVLITQRSESMPHPLQWEFPGGKLHPGESPEKCVVREISEELKITITVEQLLPAVTQEYPGNSIKLIPFVCSIVSGEIVLQQHCNYAWVEKEDLRNYNMLEADRKIIDALGVLNR